MSTSPNVHVRRTYADPGSADGTRVLVDRLWPRGIRKEDLAYDEWLKEVAPTPDLRKWFGHDPDKFKEFADRYRKELAAGPQKEAFAQLRTWAEQGTVTLLTASKRDDISAATVLQRLLTDR